jgi:hypothetical protein
LYNIYKIDVYISNENKEMDSIDNKEMDDVEKI